LGSDFSKRTPRIHLSPCGQRLFSLPESPLYATAGLAPGAVLIVSGVALSNTGRIETRHHVPILPKRCPGRWLAWQRCPHVSTASAARAGSTSSGQLWEGIGTLS